MVDLIILLAIIAAIYFVVENFYAILWVLGAVVAFIALLILYVYLAPLVKDCYLYKYGSEEQKTKVRIRREHKRTRRMHEREAKKRKKQREKMKHANDVSFFNFSKRRRIAAYECRRKELIRNYGAVTNDFVIEEYNIEQEVMSFDESKIISLMGRVMPYELLIRCRMKDKITDDDIFTGRVRYYTLMVSVYDLDNAVINISSADKKLLSDIKSFIDGIIAETRRAGAFSSAAAVYRH